MSIALMTLARKTTLPTNAKFVLMALADWANDGGMNCWPSVYELSEYLTCSERTVQRLLRELEDDGWIAVVGNAAGGGGSRQYALNVAKMAAVAQEQEQRRKAEKERRRSGRKSEASNPFAEGCQFVTPDNLSPVTTATRGVTNGAGGVTTTTSRGDTRVTLSTIYPPIDPSDNHHGVSAHAQTTPPQPQPKPAKQSPAAPQAQAAKPQPSASTTASTTLAKPDGVDAQVWADFLGLRKAKRSPLTATALAGIEREAKKAGIGLQEALETCCEAGWTGFRAAWHANREGRGLVGGRGVAVTGQTSFDPHAPVETYAQRAARQRVEEVAPGAARKAPGQRSGFERAQAFMRGADIIDITPQQPRIEGGV